MRAHQPQRAPMPPCAEEPALPRESLLGIVRDDLGDQESAIGHGRMGP